MATFDAAKFVADIEALGADLRVVDTMDGRPPEIRRSYRGANPPMAQINAAWDNAMISPERYRAVVEFLRKRQDHR